MSSRYLRFAQLRPEKSIPWSRPHIDRMEKAGQFPRRIRLGPGTVVWSENEIDEFIAAKRAEEEEKPSS